MQILFNQDPERQNFWKRKDLAAFFCCWITMGL